MEDKQQDFIIVDRPFNGYDVSYCGKFWQNFSDWDIMIQAINSKMESDSYFPDIWFINDHGNMDQLDYNGNIIEN